MNNSRFTEWCQNHEVTWEPEPGMVTVHINDLQELVEFAYEARDVIREIKQTAAPCTSIRINRDKGPSA